MATGYEAIDGLLLAMAGARVKKATRYITPGRVLKVTRVGRSPDRRVRRLYFSVTLGTPNYVEKKFIKACKKAGEPFPVKRVQLRFFREKGKRK